MSESTAKAKEVSNPLPVADTQTVDMDLVASEVKKHRKLMWLFALAVIAGILGFVVGFGPWLTGLQWHTQLGYGFLAVCVGSAVWLKVELEVPITRPEDSGSKTRA